MMTAMRRFAVLTSVLILAVGCSDDATSKTTPLPETGTAPASAVPTSSAPTSSSQAPAAPPPEAVASPEALVRWVAAGRPADPADFQTVERDGEATELTGDDVAFRLPGDLKPNTLAGCIRRLSETLSCLPGLADPPPKPPENLWQWISNWVDFNGSTITVGGYHGDPGPFSDGPGAPLPYGDSIKSGDYQCRSDPSGLYCVSLSKHTGLRMSETLTAFGCAKQATPPAGIGEQYDCS